MAVITVPTVLPLISLLPMDIITADDEELSYDYTIVIHPYQFSNSC